MAAAGFYHARLVGHGGHAAMPHTVIDPFPCVSAALSGLQTIVSRNLAPTEAGVVSTTFVRGGTAYNIIPGAVELGGTMRSLTKPGYRFIDGQIAKVLQGAAAIGGCTLNLTVSSLDADCLSQPAPEGAPGSCTFPPTVNAPSAFRLAKGAALSLVGEERFQEAAPTMGGEDFAYLTEKIPGAMIFLGIGNHTLGTDVNLHNPRFQMDEAQMPLGAAMHVEMALRSLATPAGPLKCRDTASGELDGAQAQCEEGTYIEGED
jgi:IAA-amino acid hydrolase